MTKKADALVLAIGAGGPNAGLVVPALAARNVRVRGLVRDPERAGAVEAAGAAEVTVGDLTDGASVAKALRGVTGVFYLAPIGLADEPGVGRSIVAAAREAGVKRFVFSSLVHPELTAMPHHTAKLPVEDALVNSGMEFAILHPAVFFQNYAAAWKKVAADGVLAEPWSPDTRFSRVDYRDVAEVAAIALTEDRLVNGTFELCAPGTLNRHDVSALAGEVLGKAVRAEKAPRPDDPKLTPMFDWYDRHSLLGNPLTLEAILGRPARTLRAYFAELAR